MFFNAPALEVIQPFGVFYVTKLRAETLLQITFPDPLRIVEDEVNDDSYPLSGYQREQKKKRLREIADFIETTEAAFPNSIILGANYNQDGELVEDENLRWYIESKGENDCLHLIIPTSEKLASIIDGQHRLNGFLHANKKSQSMELLCAIYLDIPNPYQAYIFATINFNQKRVDRSLAYELFGIRVEDDPPQTWTPDKTAVFLTRKLNMDEESPLHQHIIVAAQNDEILFRHKPIKITWAVSTATIVDGILRLFSSRPQKDKMNMLKKKMEDGRKRAILEDDNTPLRNLYLKTNDLALYTIVKNYFIAVRKVFWSPSQGTSYITKTVGIQALFDVLFLLLKKFKEDTSTTKKLDLEIDLGADFFSSQLTKAANVNYADSFFQASGKGRTRLKNTIALCLGLVLESKLPQHDLQEYIRVAGIKG